MNYKIELINNKTSNNETSNDVSSNHETSNDETSYDETSYDETSNDISESILKQKYRYAYFDNIYGYFLHIYGIIVFEIFFYFNYIVYIEKNEITKILKLLSNAIKENLNNEIDLLNTEDNNIMKRFCDFFDKKYVNKYNENLKDNSYDLLWFLTLLLLLFTFLHFKIICDKNKFKDKLLEVIIFVGLISLFEYLFFINIVTQYTITTNEEASCFIIKQLFN